jgi:hypothetical protein
LEQANSPGFVSHRPVFTDLPYSAIEVTPNVRTIQDPPVWIDGAAEFECYRRSASTSAADPNVYYPCTFLTPSCRGVFRLRNPETLTFAFLNPIEPIRAIRSYRVSTNFPHFPRGGPVPDEKPMAMHKDWQPLGCYVSQWGGMEVDHGMPYPVSVVDGLGHKYGGWRLNTTLQKCSCPSAITVHSNKKRHLQR